MQENLSHPEVDSHWPQRSPWHHFQLFYCTSTFVQKISSRVTNLKRTFQPIIISPWTFWKVVLPNFSFEPSSDYEHPWVSNDVFNQIGAKVLTYLSIICLKINTSLCMTQSFRTYGTHIKKLRVIELFSFESILLLRSLRAICKINSKLFTFSPSSLKPLDQYAGFELWRGYFPLLMLFRKWGEKGVCLNGGTETAWDAVKVISFNFYWMNIPLLLCLILSMYINNISMRNYPYRVVLMLIWHSKGLNQYLQSWVCQP